MKKSIASVLFLALTIITTSNTANATEYVNCVDSSGSWNVSYTLDGNWATNLKFVFLGQMETNYPPTRVNIGHFLGWTYFEFTLGTLSYFDLQRRKDGSDFTGAFLLTENPVGLETNVTCSYHE